MLDEDCTIYLTEVTFKIKRQKTEVKKRKIVGDGSMI